MRKPFAITLDVGSSRANHTGAWRTERPVYVDNLPPCNSACPAGENIQQWLYNAEEGPAKYEAAWRQIMADNPFPAIMGRVCYRPCETTCNRAQLDSAVGINSVERFLGDEALRQGWKTPVDAAPGAHSGGRAYIPAGDAAGIMDAVTRLHGMEDSGPPLLGRRVAVYGGGNTAMDAARTARRLGASEAVVVYRRTRDQMPAHDIEVTEALEEGVTMRWLSTVAQADAGKLLIEKMKLDETGFPQPTGEFEELAADCLVLALGQNADLSVLEGVPGVTFSDGVVEVGPDLMTGYPGIFAGGDMVPAERTVTVAIGHGKKAARSIDAWLREGTYAPAAKHELASFGGLNTWYYSDAPKTVRPKLDAVRRESTFD